MLVKYSKYHFTLEFLFRNEHHLKFLIPITKLLLTMTSYCIIIKIYYVLSANHREFSLTIKNLIIFVKIIIKTTN